ncbi:hypothetical protein Tco_1092512 [Tanacetum coccineum]|uniref:Reverse transcriptase domain-containing protein n=1 Tax=Tanacetum coccineum TaxID=301880 RepID=A0ABQ5IBD1_9ASTR
MPKEANAAPRVNILDFCEEHYEDILPVIMDKIRRDKQKKVHTRMDFRENTKKSQRMREGSQNSSAGTLSARLGHRRQSAFERLSDTYSPSTTMSGPDRETLGIVLTVEVALMVETFLAEIFLEAETAPVALKNHMVIPTPPTRRGPDMDITLVTETSPVQKKYVKDPVEIYNIKQRDRETIDDFIERFKVETGHMKGAPKCMRIFGFMHGVNNPELTKRLNEHVSKTMKEMMTTTTAFIRGEAAAASKKKCHTSWKT